MKKIFVLCIACLSIVIGIIGLVLPVVQGLPFIIVGTILLTMIFPNLEKIVEDQINKLGKWGSIYYKIKKFLHTKIKL